jgi:outer membrane protein assembly factor BamD (BamD/ComL family)
MKKKLITSILVLFTILAFFGCQSVPTDIQTDITEAELTKLAQAAYDNGNTKAATIYYETIIERFGDNPESFVSAKFETNAIIL